MGLYPKIETSHLAGQLRGIASKNWYVHGADGDDSSPGDRPEKPLATLQEALDRSTAAVYDTIYVTRGVVVGETTPFLLNKANVRIVGDPYAVPQQSTNCAIIATGDTDCFTFQASDIAISGFTLYAGATKSGVTFAELAWSQRNLIERCAFFTGAYGIYAPQVVDSPGHHLVIQDNFFNPGAGTTAGIRLDSNGSWQIVQRNFFETLTGTNILYIPSGVASARILDNIFMLSADTEGLAINLGANCVRFMVLNNIANDNAVGAITANPFLDNGTQNVWAGNTKGGGAWTGIAPA